MKVIIYGATDTGKSIYQEIKEDVEVVAFTDDDPKRWGDEVDGIDYFIARKILRKFEQLNIAYIRDEIDGFVDFLNQKFGENKMHECIEYLLRLKKMS